MLNLQTDSMDVESVFHETDDLCDNMVQIAPPIEFNIIFDARETYFRRPSISSTC